MSAGWCLVSVCSGVKGGYLRCADKGGHLRCADKGGYLRCADMGGYPRCADKGGHVRCADNSGCLLELLVLSVVFACFLKRASCYRHS